jgi:hypothetical protein
VLPESDDWELLDDVSLLEELLPEVVVPEVVPSEVVVPVVVPEVEVVVAASACDRAVRPITTVAATAATANPDVTVAVLRRAESR